MSPTPCSVFRLSPLHELYSSHLRTGFPASSEERGGNGSSEFVGDGFGQAKNTSKEDESRGTQVCITMAVAILSIV